MPPPADPIEDNDNFEDPPTGGTRPEAVASRSVNTEHDLGLERFKTFVEKIERHGGPKLAGLTAAVSQEGFSFVRDSRGRRHNDLDESFRKILEEYPGIGESIVYEILNHKTSTTSNSPTQPPGLLKCLSSLSGRIEDTNFCFKPTGDSVGIDDIEPFGDQHFNEKFVKVLGVFKRKLPPLKRIPLDQTTSSEFTLDEGDTTYDSRPMSSVAELEIFSSCSSEPSEKNRWTFKDVVMLCCTMADVQSSLSRSSDIDEVHPEPRHAEFRSLLDRLDSFHTSSSPWQSDNASSMLHSADMMSRAGFFLTRIRENIDSLRCHHCGIGLVNLRGDDSPFIVHAQKNPRCAHVRARFGRTEMNNCMLCGKDGPCTPLPCHHFVSCPECAFGYANCPLCNTHVALRDH